MADETSPEQAARDAEEFVRLWFERIDSRLNADDWKSWLDEADKCEKRYSLEKGATDKRFNVFYANVETIAAAVYNSVPTPDVRRRFGDADPAGKMAADVTERAISASCDLYDFDNVMDGGVHNGEIVGMGLARVRMDTKFAPAMGHNGGPPLDEDEANTVTDAEGADEAEGLIAWQSVWCEAVDWRDAVFGNATEWAGMEWMAFRHRLDREAITKLNPKVGQAIKLAQWEDGRDTKKGRKVNDDRDDKFKRGEVWEIWYKPARQVIWIARDWPDAPLAVKSDPLGLREFWPMPRPYAPIQKPHDMTPVPPYRLYAEQAKELNTISVRIAKLTAAARWRGVYDAGMAKAIKAMEGMEDGELAPIDDAMAWKDKGLSAAFFLMPIDQIVKTLAQLHADREAVKQVIYELIGVADIMRGSSSASETLGAQRLKTQWGSLRVNRRQKAVQRFARDLFRLKAEIIGKRFAPHVLSMMTGIDLQPADPQQAEVANAALQLLRGDMEREYRIDIETDSTVQADVQQAQTNASQFLQGLGLFAQGVGPAIQAGMMQGDEAADILLSISRSFKLGKQGEDALERMGKRLQEQAKQPPQPKVDPAAEQAKADAALKAEQAKAEAARKEKDMLATHEREERKFAFEVKKHDDGLMLEDRRMQMEDARAREQMAHDHALKLDGMASAHTLKQEEMTMRAQQDAAMREHSGEVADFAKSSTAKEAGALVKTMAPALEAVGQGLAQLGADMRAGLEQQAQATAQLAAATMAETELVRDPVTGRATAARKKPPAMVN